MLRRFLYDYPEVLGILKLYIYKIFFGSGLKISGIPRFSYKSDIRIRKGCRIILSDKCHITDRICLRAADKGVLEIGENVCLGQNSVIVSRDSIKIGRNVMLGPNVTIYDHDHDFRAGGNMNLNGFTSSPVVIEENVWVGSNVIILKGVRIGKNSVVAAGSVITKDVPANTIVYNKRTTETKEL